MGPITKNGKHETKSNGRPLTVKDLANHKRLSVEFLDSLHVKDLPTGGVGIEYLNAEADAIGIKRRTALQATKGSRWPAGVPLSLYGLWRRPEGKILFLVEGESDVWAMLFHSLPCLGVPGADTVGASLKLAHLRGFETIYIHQEPDQGGERFVRNVREQLKAIGFKGKAFAWSCGNGIKDPADLHVGFPDDAAFARQIEGAIKSARLVYDEPALAWEPSTPFEATIDVPAFPVDLLPPFLASWVKAVSEATQTPPDLAALLSLTLAGAALAKKFRAQIRPGWSEPSNIYTATALLPSERKTTVFGQAMAPVIAFEKEELERMKPLIAAAQSELRILGAKLAAAEKTAAKETDVEKHRQGKAAAFDLARQVEAFTVSCEPRAFTDDVTAEKLGQILGQQGGRMLLASAEGTLFENAKGRYSESPNFDIYLRGFSEDPIRTGRVGRADDIVDAPNLSIALAVQPEVIRGLADSTTMKGKGFLARFWFAMPTSWVGSRRVRPAPVPAKVSALYHQNMLTLWRLPLPEKPSVVPFTPAADEGLADFERWLEPQLAEDAALGQLAGWPGKLAGGVARLALILHVLDGDGGEQIPEATVSRAIKIGREYLLPHAQAAFQLMGANPQVEAAKAVLKWIRADKLTEFTKRDVHQQFRTKFATVDDIDPVLDLLSKHNYIRLRPAPPKEGPGRKPSPTYEVNPA
jgi:hypothetical protein